MPLSRPILQHDVHRRQFLGTLLGGTGVMTCGGLSFGSETAVTSELKGKQKQVLFLWLAGGASQFEMWDPKPGRETGGPFRSIASAVTGYQVGELMPNLAARMKDIAVVRSLDTEITAHAPAADLISTGRPKEPVLKYPEIGVLLSHQLALKDSRLPNYVSMFTFTEGRRRPTPGYLGGKYAPLLLEDSLRPKHIDRPEGLTANQHQQREELRALLSQRFSRQRAGADFVNGYNSAYEQVRGLMKSDHLFDLSKEPEDVRHKYGNSDYGKQCLLARRLLEAGVPVVKVAHGFWDSHHDNFESHRELVPNFDQVTSVLLDDLKQRGLLESTLVMVLSEFGRTPKINPNVGRDHYAAAWSVAFAGCGVQGGTVYGKTDEDGKTVVEGKADAADLAATIFEAVGLDSQKHLQVGLRPVPLAAETSLPITGILQ